MEDDTLCGFLKVIRVFLQNRPNSLEYGGLAALIKDLIEKCLLSVEYKPLE